MPSKCSRRDFFLKHITVLTLNIFTSNQRIPIVQHIKYLEVTLDTRLTFRYHIKKAALSTTNLIAFLAILMPNISEPNASRRKQIMIITNNQLLYGVTASTKVVLNKIKVEEAARTTTICCSLLKINISQLPSTYSRY